MPEPIPAAYGSRHPWASSSQALCEHLALWYLAQGYFGKCLMCLIHHGLAFLGRVFFNPHNSDQVIMHIKSWSSFAVGHAVLSINGVDVMGKNTAEGKDILEYLKDPSSYPVSIRFGRARLSSNEKLMLASMFHS